MTAEKLCIKCCQSRLTAELNYTNLSEQTYGSVSVKIVDLILLLLDLLANLI